VSAGVIGPSLTAVGIPIIGCDLERSTRVHVEPVAPLTLVSVGLVLVAVSAVTTVVPGTCAATVDTVSVLRTD